jgi:zinc protease
MIKYKTFIFFFVLLFSISSNTTVSAKIKKIILPDGLTVLSLEDHSQPILAVQMWINTGSALENDSNSGVSHFIEHMLFKGTPRLEGTQIPKIVESKGGLINAATSKDFTYFHLVMPSEYADTALDVLGDIIMNSNFPADELEKERLVILEEIKRQDDDPENELWNIFNRKIYREVPYARPVIGTFTSIKNMNREALLEYYHKFYAPNNMTLVIAGDFDSAAVILKIKHIFSGFPAQKIEKPLYAKPVEQKASSIEEIRDVQQAHLIMGNLGPNIESQDQYALDILTYILGNGMNSRLYRRVQEEQRLVESIRASFMTMKKEGPIFITAVCEPAKIDLAKEAIVSELVKLKKETPSQEELKRVKTIIKSEYLLSNQTYAEQAFNLGYYQTLSTYKFNQTYLDNIDKVTAEDILRAANKYIDPDKITTVIIRPK